jgi:hypothetical protein
MGIAMNRFAINNAAMFLVLSMLGCSDSVRPSDKANSGQAQSNSVEAARAGTTSIGPGPAANISASPQSRAQMAKNLRDVSQAIFAYETAKGTFPPAAIEIDGKPALSWRVAILPYLGEHRIYRDIHLDEPWDSPHNLEAAKKVPKAYQSPGAADGKTEIMALTGNGLAFEGSKRVARAELAKLPRDTVLLVETGPDKAVPWTMPMDVQLERGKPFAANLGQFPDDGFHMVDCNGTVERVGVNKAMLERFRKP